MRVTLRKRGSATTWETVETTLDEACRIIGVPQAAVMWDRDLADVELKTPPRIYEMVTANRYYPLRVYHGMKGTYLASWCEVHERWTARNVGSTSLPNRCPC